MTIIIGPTVAAEKDYIPPDPGEHFLPKRG